MLSLGFCLRFSLRFGLGFGLDAGVLDMFGCLVKGGEPQKKKIWNFLGRFKHENSYTSAGTQKVFFHRSVLGTQ